MRAHATRAALRAFRDEQHVRAQRGECGYLFGDPRRPQDRLPVVRVVDEARLERRQPAGHAFETDEFANRETGAGRFGDKLVGPVEVRGGEPLPVHCRVPVLAVDDVAFDDRAEPRVEQVVEREPGKEGCVPGDGGDEHDAAGPHHPAGLGEGAHPICFLGEVVGGAEQQHCIAALVVFLEAAGVAPRRREGPAGRDRVGDRLLDVRRDEVDQVHVVTAGREPGGVDALTASDVEYPRRWRRHMPADHLLGAQEFESAGTLGDPRTLRPVSLVETHDLGRLGHRHDCTGAATRRPVSFGAVTDTTPDETQLDALIARLTLEEKASLTAGTDLWHTPGVERLGIAPLKVTDGPNGARGGRWGATPSLCFPCGTALGATWDPDLVREVGECLAGEARDKRAQMLLAPTVNLHRHPYAGRNFECYSEDPYLSARMTVSYITGVQRGGVSACVKHFVANDQEFERMTISADVDERVLRELYLVPFEAAVNEAGTWALMTAYNRLNGTYCSEQPWSVDRLLKTEWGFDGVVVSDWFGTHSTAPAANAGLDLEMPGPAQWLGEKLVAAIEAGEVDEATLDDKVRRLLRLRARVGLALGGAATRAPDEEEELGIDDPARRAVARRAAAGAFVLLRNEGLLPLNPKRVKTLAVIGPNADIAMVQGGGSASVTPHASVSPLAGLRAQAPDGMTIRFERGASISKRTPALSTRHLDGDLTISYYEGRERAGDVVFEEHVRSGYFVWLGRFSRSVPDDFSARITGTFVASEPGPWTFSLVQAGRARLLLDGEVVVDNWSPTEHSDAFFGFGSAEALATVDLAEGERRELTVEFVPAGPGMGGLSIGCRAPEPADLEDRAVALARDADAVVLVVGTDSEWESEGHDRESLHLPGSQEQLIDRVLAANSRTVVVVNAASPVSMDWAERAAAVMQIWFPGEECGNALADVLVGAVSPSGRLPTTIPYGLQDTPTYKFYPGENGKVVYDEGLLMGYRGYDANDTDPRYPFGYGLTYSTFDYGAPQVNNATFHDGDRVEITVPVTNTGGRAAAEVVQCYVHDVDASVERPPQELKAFAKVLIEPGQTAAVPLVLDRRSFAFWDGEARGWVVEPGTFEARIGSSSRDIKQTVVLTCE